MIIRTVETILRSNPFFAGLAEAHLHTLAGCGSNARFKAGDVIFRQRDRADRFFVIQSGRVAVDLETPDARILTIQTLEANDILGWSWLFPPYRWNFNARAVEDTHAIALDAECLRGKCERDTAMGYDLMKRFSAIMMERLNATRMQIMDVYGR